MNSANGRFFEISNFLRNTAKIKRHKLLILWSWRQESNLRPTDYKSVALPTELRQLESLSAVQDGHYS